MPRERPVSILLVVCVFGAFLMLLLVSLSMPIIKPLYLVDVQAIPVQGEPATTTATDLRFGVWGFCATSALDQPTLLTNDGRCTKPHLGFVIDQTILDDTGYAQIAQAIIEGITFVLILHPIAAALALLSLLLAVPAARSHCWGILNLIIVIIAALLTTVVLAIDFVLITELKDRLGPLTNLSLEVSFGNCPWMVLVATVLIWASVILGSFVVCNCFGCGLRRHRDWDDDETYVKN